MTRVLLRDTTRVVIALTGLFLGGAPAQAQMPAHWTNVAGGNWNFGGNWSGGVVPNNGTPAGSNYDAFIDAAGTYTVALNTPITVNKLTMGNVSATLTVSNTLTIVNSTALGAGVIRLSAGTIVGGTMAGGGRLVPDSGFNNVLSGVALTTNVLDASAFGRLRLTNGANFSGTGTLAMANAFSLYFEEGVTVPVGVDFSLIGGATISADAGFTTTLAAGNPNTVNIRLLGSATLGAGLLSSAPNSVLVNQGRIQFDVSATNAVLTILSQGAGSRFQNAGNLVASSSGAANTVNMSSLVNTGTLTAATGGIINLGGTFTRADLGTIANTGGTINISGTLDNTGSTLALDSTTGPITLASGTILGGTIAVTGTGKIRANGGTGNVLSGVSLGAGTLDMASSMGRLRLTNGTNFSGAPGTIPIGSGSSLYIEEAATIPGGFNFSLNGSSSLSAEGGFTATLGAATADSVTINLLGSGTIGGGLLSSTPNSILVNQGRIQFGAATVNSTLTITSQGAGGQFRNEGNLIASSAGGTNTINLSAPFTNAGTLIAAAGGAINLSGAFTRADLGNFANTGGTIRLNGSLDNTGANLDLNNSTGSIVMSNATIIAGTVTGAGNGHLRPDASFGNTLNNVVVGNGAIDLATTFGRLQLRNGTTFAGGPNTIPMAQGSQLFINQSATVSAGTTITMTGGASVSAEGGNTATIAAATPDSVTVNMLGSGSIGGGFLSATPNCVLINQGRIQFDPAAVNSTLTITSNGAGSRFRNEGKLVAGSAGATNTINMLSFTNTGTLVAAPGGVINLTGAFSRADMGNFNNTGGSINVVGTLSNTSLDLNNATGSLTINGGTISGGTVTATGNARLKLSFSQSNLISGVTLGANVLDLSAAPGRVQFTNGTNFSGSSGAVALALGSQLFLNQAATIGSGYSFALTGGSTVSAEGGNTVTLGAASADTTTVNMLGSGAIGGGFLSETPNSVLVNQGRIQFDPATVNAILTITSNVAGSRFRNEGNLVASSAGVANTINMTAFTNAGTLTARSGGIINLNGTFTRADLGAFTNAGGAINLAGTLINTASGLDLNSTTGSFTLTAGAINGGTITATGGARLLANASASNTLNGVNLAFDAFDLSQPLSRVRLSGGTTLTGVGTILLGASSAVYLFQTEPIMSGINFALSSSSSVSAEGVTATLAAASPSISKVRVAAGVGATVGAGILTEAANSVLVNQGTIDFAGPNSTLSVISGGTGSRVQNDGVLTANAVGTNIAIGGATTFTNNGVLAADGGTVNVPATATFTNFNLGKLTGGTYRVYSSSEINLNGRMITAIAANTTVLLDGASSVFTAANAVTANNGSFTISNGRQHTVPTFINGGLLQVGTAAGDLAKMTANVQVNGGGIVRGTGTIQGSLYVLSGGTLAPGASPGILTVTGLVTLNSGVNFSIELSGSTLGSGYSQLNLAGGGLINLNGSTLVTNLNYAPNPGDSFTIVSGGAVINIFNGLPQGSTVNLGIFQGTPYVATITYAGSTVVLNVPVPEPATILAACAGFGVVTAGVRRWKQRRDLAV